MMLRCQTWYFLISLELKVGCLKKIYILGRWKKLSITTTNYYYKLDFENEKTHRRCIEFLCMYKN